MNRIKSHLHICFARKGGEPLVSSAFWIHENGAPETIALLNEDILGAKPRRRAICIMLLLAKYQNLPNVKGKPVIRFKDEMAELTWIGTLGEIYRDRAPAEKWVRTHFCLGHTECIFFSVDPGSIRAKGKTYPSVDFYPKILPVSNLHFFTKSSRSLNGHMAVIPDDRLLDFAKTLEIYRWKVAKHKSSIDEMVKLRVLQPPPLAKLIDLSVLSQGFVVSLNKLNDDCSLNPGNSSAQSKFSDLTEGLIKTVETVLRAECDPFLKFLEQGLSTWHGEQWEIIAGNVMTYSVSVIDSAWKALDPFWGTENITWFPFEMEDYHKRLDAMITSEEMKFAIWRKEGEQMLNKIEALLRDFLGLSGKELRYSSGVHLEKCAPRLLLNIRNYREWNITKDILPNCHIRLGFFLSQKIGIDLVLSICLALLGPESKWRSEMIKLQEQLGLNKNETINYALKRCLSKENFIGVAKGVMLGAKWKINVWPDLRRLIESFSD